MSILTLFDQLRTPPICTTDPVALIMVDLLLLEEEEKTVHLGTNLIMAFIKNVNLNVFKDLFAYLKIRQPHFADQWSFDINTRTPNEFEFHQDLLLMFINRNCATVYDMYILSHVMVSRC